MKIYQCKSRKVCGEECNFDCVVHAQITPVGCLHYLEAQRWEELSGGEYKGFLIKIDMDELRQFGWEIWKGKENLEGSDVYFDSVQEAIEDAQKRIDSYAFKRYFGGITTVFRD